MPRIERWLVALAGGFAASPIAYALVRVAERAFFPEPDPAIVVWSERSALVWRSVLAAYASGFAAFAFYALTEKHREKAARILPGLVLVSVSFFVVVGAIWP